jgi:hypothetical protein
MSGPASSASKGRKVIVRGPRECDALLRAEAVNGMQATDIGCSNAVATTHDGPAVPAGGSQSGRQLGSYSQSGRCPWNLGGQGRPAWQFRRNTDSHAGRLRKAGRAGEKRAASTRVSGCHWGLLARPDGKAVSRGPQGAPMPAPTPPTSSSSSPARDPAPDRSRCLGQHRSRPVGLARLDARRSSSAANRGHGHGQ